MGPPLEGSLKPQQWVGAHVSISNLSTEFHLLFLRVKKHAELGGLATNRHMTYKLTIGPLDESHSFSTFPDNPVAFSIFSLPSTTQKCHSTSQWEPSVAVQKCQRRLTLACRKSMSKSLCGGGRKSICWGRVLREALIKVGAWDGTIESNGHTSSPTSSIPNVMNQGENMLFPYPLSFQKFSCFSSVGQLIRLR